MPDNYSGQSVRKPSVEVYDEVLSGKLMRFPSGFFSDNGIVDMTNTCIPIIKHLIEEILKWDDAQICQLLSREVFHNYKLSGMLSHYFNDSPYEAINAAYPDRFKPWEMQCLPRNYWNEKTSTEAVKWLIEEKLGWNEEQVCKNISVAVFKQYNLGGLLRTSFKDSSYDAIVATYPEKYFRTEYNLCLKNKN